MKVAVFGGSFNPVHRGHITSLLAVVKHQGFDKIYVVPTYRTPGRPAIRTPTPKQRLKMLELALADHAEVLQLDDREIRRGGISYTIDTLKEFVAEQGEGSVSLIIGADLVENFHTWKDFEEILEIADLVVTTRPGSHLPFKIEDLPLALAPLVEELGPHGGALKSGRLITFVRLKDVEVSGTEIRKHLRSGLKVDRFLPIAVEQFISKESLYVGGEKRIPDFEKFTHFCAEVLNAKKAIHVRGFDIRKLHAPTEFTIMASGTSTRHAAALADNLMDAVRDKYGVHPLSVEGTHEGRWVLLDYGSLIIHVFYDFVRPDYKLEELWATGKEMVFETQSSVR